MLQEYRIRDLAATTVTLENWRNAVLDQIGSAHFDDSASEVFFDMEEDAPSLPIGECGDQDGNVFYIRSYEPYKQPQAAIA